MPMKKTEEHIIAYVRVSTANLNDEVLAELGSEAEGDDDHSTKEKRPDFIATRSVVDAVMQGLL